MKLKQVKEILNVKGFSEIIDNDYGTLFICDTYRIAIIFTEVYSENNIEHYEELRNNAKVSDSVLDPSYLDKSTLMVFNTTTDDLGVTLCDTTDFIKSTSSIINFLPEQRKTIFLDEMSSASDRGADIWISPFTRFNVNGFLNNIFKLLFKNDRPITIKYPPILYDSMTLVWIEYWVKKISL